MNFKLAPLAIAVAAVVAAPTVLASENGNHHHDRSGSQFTEKTSVEVSNKVSVKTQRTDQSSRDVNVEGTLNVYGNVPIDSSSTSMIDDKQINTNNSVDNVDNQNNSTVGDSALQGASGNIGSNTASGDNNMQDNAAALSASDASFVFGSSDASAITYQANRSNDTVNHGNVNNATLTGSALSGAAGNIGVNIAAGSSNLQKNNFSGSVATARIANANVTNIQRSGGNSTSNSGNVHEYNDTTQVTLSGGMMGLYGGTTSGTYQGTSSGTTQGVSDQRGNVYLDIWGMNSTGSVPTHPTDAPPIGHVDVDNQAQGAQDPNGNGGAFTFDNTGSYSGTQSGSYAGHEVGGQALWGSFSGNVVTTRYVITPSQNNATLNGSALSGASGNIGVNVAAGTGNMQNNSLAIAATQAGLTAPTPTPGEQ